MPCHACGIKVELSHGDLCIVCSSSFKSKNGLSVMFNDGEVMVEDVKIEDYIGKL